MNNLKNLAMKARNRLLNKGLRDTYTNANVMSCSDLDFNENVIKETQENIKKIIADKYLFRENIMMNMTNDEKERFILDTFRRYKEEKRKLEKDII